jgi:hypothetical protein
MNTLQGNGKFNNVPRESFSLMLLVTLSILNAVLNIIFLHLLYSLFHTRFLLHINLTYLYQNAATNVNIKNT